jgi:PleD family two-component response regulator
MYVGGTAFPSGKTQGAALSWSVPGTMRRLEKMSVSSNLNVKATVSDEFAQPPLVLVVDDDADIRASLTDMFLSVGMETLTYGSTAELMAAGLPDRPSCLILDLRLPGVSGLELQA